VLVNADVSALVDSPRVTLRDDLGLCRLHPPCLVSWAG
jgi:hypothetical protein